MPVNHHKEELQARQAINKFLEKKGAEGFLYVELAKTVLLTFAVSEGMVKHFIQTYYINTREYTNNEGFIQKVKE